MKEKRFWGRKKGWDCSIYVLKDEIGPPPGMCTKWMKSSMLWVEFSKRDGDNRDSSLFERHYLSWREVERMKNRQNSSRSISSPRASLYWLRLACGWKASDNVIDCANNHPLFSKQIKDSILCSRLVNIVTVTYLSRCHSEWYSLSIVLRPQPIRIRDLGLGATRTILRTFRLIFWLYIHLVFSFLSFCFSISFQGRFFMLHCPYRFSS